MTEPLPIPEPVELERLVVNADTAIAFALREAEILLIQADIASANLPPAAPDAGLRDLSPLGR